MVIKRASQLAAIGIASFIIGVAAIGAVSGTPLPGKAPRIGSVSTPSERPYETPVPAEGVVPGSTGTNDAGQTFGQWNETPDAVLVEAIATNGAVGYVYAIDLMGPRSDEPLTPERAAKMQPTARMIPVFLEDGLTKVGEFKVGIGVVSEVTE